MPAQHAESVRHKRIGFFTQTREGGGRRARVRGSDQGLGFPVTLEDSKLLGSRVSKRPLVTLSWASVSFLRQLLDLGLQ